MICRKELTACVCGTKEFALCHFFLLLHLPLLRLSSSTSSSVQLQQQVLQGLQADRRVPQLGGQEEEASVLGHGAQREPLMELSNTQSIGLVLGQTDTPLTWAAPESLQVL